MVLVALGLLWMVAGLVLKAESVHGCQAGVGPRAVSQHSLPIFFQFSLFPCHTSYRPLCSHQLTPLLRYQLHRAEKTMDGTQSRRDSRIGSR